MLEHPGAGFCVAGEVGQAGRPKHACMTRSWPAANLRSAIMQLEMTEIKLPGRLASAYRGQALPPGERLACM